MHKKNKETTRRGLGSGGSGSPGPSDESRGDGCSRWGSQTGCQKTLGEKTSTTTNMIKE